ncbi:MarR family winged helix-turn-helix transcriptional regulator [Trueperella bialowiezensis]|uniref:Homoprotocatechuate degradation operon regulator, HpaR n=1 Tax=Trueperella bialowiezensis TaxID=312285 RepID=A0A3S4YXJ4_9ACTO|nr:MarR family winged helix-turn-helix transcriptional regulator [Trueperella bialowiezensis]VEI13030.1 homoprotocatechuate degradation operon regulator, HpaR [Trueperella bialowiezensis]
MTTERDEVDEVVAAWKQQRPDFDVEPLEVFSRLLRINRHFTKFRRAIYANHGLETWEFEMLAALRRAPGHTMTAGQLMKDTFVSSGTITNRIDRMQKNGLVTRAAAPEDGRVVQVCATPKGIEAVDGAMGEILEVEREILSEVGPERTAAAADYLSAILQALAARS